MKLTHFVKKDLVLLDVEFSSKEEALKNLAQNLVEKGYAKDPNKVLELALKREGEFSTGIGGGIAIPHIRDEVMNNSVITYARVKKLDWQSLDNQEIEHIFFISLKPSDAENSHMEIISSLSSLFLDEKFVNSLKNIKTYEELIELMSNNITKTDDLNQNSQSKYDVVAVTACPTGIAHTFMAKDMLLKAAKEMNIKIKVETQGAEGTKNKLSEDDIKNAKGVIIAVDRVVDLSRFTSHENVLEMGTKAVIKDGKKEIQRSLNKEGTKIKGQAKRDSSSNAEELISFDNFGKRLYKSLMTGVSYMLPFVVFGGILIALAFLIDISNAGKDDFGSINPIAKWFKTLGGLAFSMMIPILCAYITYAIVGRQGLLPGFVVGLISSGKFLGLLNTKTGSIEWGKISETGATSGVFGAVIGGFLAAAILIALIKYVFIYIPQSLNGIKNILIIPLFGTLLIATTFWIVNIPIIYLNYGFTWFLSLMEGKQYLSWLLGGILGAMMAIDLGGPINKAAYVFGITSLTAGGTSQATMSMAAAMAGGMTPPIAIALSCTFFKKLWTQDERNSGMLNYIMGLTFISEGAIPFTAAKPKLLIPSNIVSGTITGLIIGSFQVKIQAPHGGILTIALAKTEIFGVSGAVGIGLGILLFIIAIILGSIAGMFTIAILSKVYSRKNNNNDLDSGIKQINSSKLHSKACFKKFTFKKNIVKFQNYSKLQKIKRLKLSSGVN